jgi:hypothetical protein
LYNTYSNQGRIWKNEEYFGHMEVVLMVAVWIMLWLGVGILAYFNTKGIFVRDSHLQWDRATKDFVLIISLLLGPIFLIISLEARLLIAVGHGLDANKTRRYKDV